jgi:hypothetical protein
MLASPRLEEIVRQLCAGKVVLLFLGSSKREENEAAASTLHEVCTAADPTEGGLSLLEVDRNDPAEEWLVRELLAVEEGLAEADQPMVFGIIVGARIMSSTADTPQAHGQAR